MIIVKTWGGIGNQLFQYVFGQYLFYKYHHEVKYDDNSYVTTDKLRKRELDKINVHIVWDNHCTFSLYKGIRGRMLRYLYQANPKHHFINKEKRMPYSFNSRDEYYFQSYWQDYKYYSWLNKHVPFFKLESRDFPVELEYLKRKIQSTRQSVSIHVRRGDYFRPDLVGTYGVCTENYFQTALNVIRDKIESPHFFLFSDDIEWVEKHLDLGDNVEVVPNYEISQFAYIELMSMCYHHIISNSSFSWWGAVLNEQEGAIVISPKRWTLTSENTIALDKWMKI